MKKLKIQNRIVSWFVFDIDGVLIDVGRSFFLMFHQLAELYHERGFIRYSELEVDRAIRTIKQFPGMNDDWDSAEALVAFLYEEQSLQSSGNKVIHHLNSGQGWTTIRTILQPYFPFSFDLIRDEARSLYGGFHCQTLYGFPSLFPGIPGTCENEKPLIDPETILSLHGHKLIYTGRDSTELSLALNMLRIKPENFALIVDTDSGFLKPDPTPLVQFYEHFIDGEEIGIFFGDSGADLKTVERFNQIIGRDALHLVAIGDLIRHEGLRFPSVRVALEHLLIRES